MVGGDKGQEDGQHTAYDKDRLYGSDEELSSDLLEDIPFDAVAFSIMKADGKFGTDEEQRTGKWR